MNGVCVSSFSELFAIEWFCRSIACAGVEVSFERGLPAAFHVPSIRLKIFVF